jgi:ACS family hexuronate transporter-like MFS transporter
MNYPEPSNAPATGQVGPSLIDEEIATGHAHIAGGVGGYRWVICALLFFATTINYVDRQILSLLKPILDEQLHWTSTQFGAINSAFQASYGLSLFVFGWFIDKYGTKIGYAVSIFAWSLAAIGHALVGSINGFFVARIALGLGEGGNFPAAIKATAQWFPKKERALATSLFNSGANVGAIVAPALVPAIALHLGWHWAFIFAGLAGLVWLLFWFPFFDYPEKSRRVSAAEIAYIESDAPDPSDGGGKVSWGAVLRHREAWSFIAAKFLTDPVWWFFLIWLPDFFKKTRHLDIKNSWTLLVSIYAIITVLSIFGGWVTGFLTSRGWSVTRARKTGMFIFALAVLPMAIVTRVGDWTAVILIGLAGAAHQAWSANLYTTVSDMLPKRAVASLTGIGGTAGSLGGMAFPLITGVVLDKFVNGYAIIFGFCSVAYLLAFAVNHLLAPKFEPVAFRTD